MEAKCGGETNIPPKGNTIYQWPSDLLKPSAVLFLDLCESDRLKRMKTRGEVETNEELQLRNSQFRQRQVFKKADTLITRIGIIIKWMSKKSDHEIECLG